MPYFSAYLLHTRTTTLPACRTCLHCAPFWLPGFTTACLRRLVTYLYCLPHHLPPLQFTALLTCLPAAATAAHYVHCRLYRRRLLRSPFLLRSLVTALDSFLRSTVSAIYWIHCCSFSFSATCTATALPATAFAAVHHCVLPAFCSTFLAGSGSVRTFSCRFSLYLQLPALVYRRSRSGSF